MILPGRVTHPYLQPIITTHPHLHTITAPSQHLLSHTLNLIQQNTNSHRPNIPNPPTSADLGSYRGINDHNLVLDRKWADVLFRGLTEDYYFNKSNRHVMWGNPEHHIFQVTTADNNSLNSHSTPFNTRTLAHMPSHHHLLPGYHCRSCQFKLALNPFQHTYSSPHALSSPSTSRLPLPIMPV